MGESETVKKVSSNKGVTTPCCFTGCRIVKKTTKRVRHRRPKKPMSPWQRLKSCFSKLVLRRPFTTPKPVDDPELAGGPEMSASEDEETHYRFCQCFENRNLQRVTDCCIAGCLGGVGVLGFIMANATHPSKTPV